MARNRGSLHQVLNETISTDSYASRSAAEAQTYLHGEIECVNAAAGIAIEMAGPRGPMDPYILSVGSTPTAHVSDERGGDGQRLVLNGELEM